MLRGTWKRQAGRKNPGDGIDPEKKEEVRMALSNSQYDAIMRVYNQRQFQDKRDQDQRVAEVFEKIPQVEALSDELAGRRWPRRRESSLPVTGRQRTS